MALIIVIALFAVFIILARYIKARDKHNQQNGYLDKHTKELRKILPNVSEWLNFGEANPKDIHSSVDYDYFGYRTLACQRMIQDNPAVRIGDKPCESNLFIDGTREYFEEYVEGLKCIRVGKSTIACDDLNGVAYVITPSQMFSRGTHSIEMITVCDLSNTLFEMLVTKTTLPKNLTQKQYSFYSQRYDKYFEIVTALGISEYKQLEI